ncbi:hypothetical protein K5V07_13890 [Flavobacterium sp. CHNK8]|uniref:hypothetical protein n=1 Tax=Flavobacterium sp. CHNK8 TaxID=2871165 RepID=UPI001C8E3EA2|nr:hypothetical protein [Flavobacterium sp. CHNK8]QZK91530.1 hypothetical protein K5V07_13890 [Flavobacterium sp. CHNK8]
MVNYIKIFSICLFCFSCVNKDKCNNTVSFIGSYKNIYDKEAKNILIINANGTFEQIFTKDNIEKKHRGTYKYFKDDCTVIFEKLKILHSLPKRLLEHHMEEYPATFRNNNIVFGGESDDDINYYRIDE